MEKFQIIDLISDDITINRVKKFCITIYGKNIELSNDSNLEILESHSIKQNEREKINELYQLITNK